MSQSYTLEEVTSIPLDADTFYGVDDFGAIYTSKDNIFHKSTPTAHYQFTALQLGTISSVDIINPLKITLFYESSNTAVILDNTLTEITRINFSTIESFRNVNHVTTASDRRLWIFNTDLQQLEIFDWNTGSVIKQFPPLAFIASGLQSNFNFAWVASSDAILYYNNYGSFLTNITLPNVSLFAQSNGDLIAFAKAKLYYKPKENTSFNPVTIPDLSIKQLSMNGEIVYLYDGQKLHTFRLKLAK